MSLKKLIDLDLLDRFLEKVKALIPSAATNNPYSLGTAAIGSSNKYAREDHVHPVTGLITDIQYNPTSKAIRKVKNGAISDVVSAATLQNAMSVFTLVADGTEINANDDLNGYKTPGNYYCTSKTIAETIVNGPPNCSYYKLVVFRNEGASTTNFSTRGYYQIAFTYSAESSALVLIRALTSAGWTAWKDISDAATVNGHTVESDVPANAVFTDTTYTPASSAPGKVASSSSTGTSTNYARQDHTHGIDLATGDSNGQVKIAGQNVSVKGLKNLAYADSVTTVNGHSVQSDVPANAVFTDTTYTPASSDPLMDGTAAVGTSVKYAREDHMHPRDSKVFSLMYETEIPVDSDLDTYTTPGNYFCSSATNAKKIANSPAVIAYKLVVVRIVSAARYYQIAFPNGVPNIYIRYYSGSAWSDWVNVRDANKVNGHTVESDVPANAVFTDTTYTPASATPLKDGTGAVGTSVKYAREDHVHPTDTTRAALASPTFTGTPKAPTATAGTNTTQIATTEFVGNAVSGKVNTINGLYYGECDTAAATAAKTVTLTDGNGFSLVEGAKVCIRFVNANSAADPTLNVNSTGAKPIVRYGTTAIGTTAGASGDWSAGGVVLLVYDGTSWVEHYWHNNTYSSMTVAEYTAGKGTTGRTITPARLKAAIAMHSAPKVYTASIPTTGWTTASAYGAYIDVTFSGATFTADDTVFVDLNLSSDTNLQTINDAWSCLLRATPTASSAKIRFKFSEVPTVAIPVRAVVL